jgi:hypothetical protein
MSYAYPKSGHGFPTLFVVVFALYIIYLANKGQVVAVVAVIVIVWKLELQLHVQLVHITTKVVSSW